MTTKTYINALRRHSAARAEARTLKSHIIRLFNAGVLTLVSAEWYRAHGIAIVCAGGRVIDMVAYYD